MVIGATVATQVAASMLTAVLDDLERDAGATARAGLRSENGTFSELMCRMSPLAG
jgi:hypothetical protein